MEIGTKTAFLECCQNVNGHLEVDLELLTENRLGKSSLSPMQGISYAKDIFEPEFGLDSGRFITMYTRKHEKFSKPGKRRLSSSTVIRPAQLSTNPRSNA